MRARQVLNRLNEAEQLQRRIKWQATKALIAIHHMQRAAAAKLATLSQSDRARWSSECRVVEQILERIKNRGV
jgi:hypothetical protein